MRAPAVLALLLVLGSVTPFAVQATGPPLALRDCSYVGGVFRVPAAAAQPYLPEGFEAVPASLVPGRVQLFVFGFACAHADTPDGRTLHDVRMLTGELGVSPPLELEREGALRYTIPVLHLASPEPFADALAGLGYGGVAAAAVERTNVPTPAITLASYETSGAQLLFAMVEPGGGMGGAGSWRAFGVADAAVRSIVDVTFSTSQCAVGAGALLVDGGVSLLDDALPVATGGECRNLGFDYVLAAALG